MMKVVSVQEDRRIKATNILVEISIREYLTIAGDILDTNEYQRKRVIKSSVSQLLKNDLLIGCTIPPIVLAVKMGDLPDKFNFETFSDEEEIKQIFQKKNLLILDGLQRTYVILDIERDFKNRLSKDNSKEARIEYERFLSHVIRAEIYLGLNKIGILYRMLTLNTGQTTMSTRHLMEILYLDYLEIDIDGIKLISDKESKKVAKDYLEYNFKDVLDGFYSFIEKREVLIQRAEILDNIKTLKSLAEIKSDKDIFKEFVLLFRQYLIKVDSLFEGIVLDKSDFESPEFRLNGTMFGKDVISIFKKSQTLTGFGAALATLKDLRGLSFDDFSATIENLSIDKDPRVVLLTLVKNFDTIRDRSKKVGNDQRYYFKMFFRSIFDPELDHTTKLDKAVDYAYSKVSERIFDEF